MKNIIVFFVLLSSSLFSQSTFFHIYDIAKGDFRHLQALPDNNILAGGTFVDSVTGFNIPYIVKVDHESEIVWQRNFYEYPDKSLRQILPLPDGRYWIRLGSDTTSLIINSDGGIYEDDVIWNTPEYYGLPYLVENDWDIFYMDVPDEFTAPGYAYHPVLTKKNYAGVVLWQQTFSRDTFDTFGDINQLIALEDGYLLSYSYDYFTDLELLEKELVTSTTKLDFGGEILYHREDTGFHAIYYIPVAGGGFKFIGVLTDHSFDVDPIGIYFAEVDAEGDILFSNYDESMIGLGWSGMYQRDDGGFDLLGVGSSYLYGSEEKVELYRFDAYCNLMDVHLLGYSDVISGRMIRSADGNYIIGGSYDYDYPFEYYPYLMKFDSLGNIAKTEITGYIFDDVNSNGVFDADDKPKKDRIITVDDKPYYGTTDDNGLFHFFVYDTGTYVLRTEIPMYYFQQYPLDDAPHTFTLDTLGGPVDEMNFMIGIQDTVFDLLCTVEAYPNRPGTERHVYLLYKNIGTIASLPAIITLTIDSLNVFGTDLDDANVVTDSSLVWYAGIIPPGFGGYKMVDVSVLPDFTLIGDSIHLSGIVLPDSADANAADNSFEFTAVITSSWDPNEKTVQPSGVTEYGFINPDTKELLYTIHFQNTGNDTAFKVVLIDTLADELNIASLNMLFASHNYSVQFDYPNVVKWYFDDIVLPDSTANEEESKGFVQFKIDLQNDLPAGTQFSNKAFIYFDNNPAVITEPVYTTLQVFVPQVINNIEHSMLQVYPNPASNTLIIALTDPASIIVSDITGHVVKSLENISAGEHQLPLHELNAGTYVIQANNGVYSNTLLFIISR